MAGGNVLPVFEPQKAVLDLGVLLMAGFVVWTRVLGCLFLARYPRRDTRLAFRLISSSRCALQDQISLWAAPGFLGEGRSLYQNDMLKHLFRHC